MIIRKGKGVARVSNGNEESEKFHGPFSICKWFKVLLTAISSQPTNKQCQTIHNLNEHNGTDII